MTMGQGIIVSMTQTSEAGLVSQSDSLRLPLSDSLLFKLDCITDSELDCIRLYHSTITEAPKF